ncbi:MAG: flippase [Thermoleophilia bacterium]
MPNSINKTQPALTRGSLLARNTVWHLFGQVIPLLVALVSIPILMRGLGTDKFGVLTLAWLIIGYFSFFDMGLGRALTILVAEKLDDGSTEEVNSLIWSAMSLLLVPGMLSAVVMAVGSPWLVHSLLKIPDELQSETLNAFYLFALAVPIVVGTEALIGLLMARQRHDLVNTVKIPMGILMFMGPVVMLLFTDSLFAVIGMLVVIRIVAMLAQLSFCLSTYPGLWRRHKLEKKNIRSLIHFGSWMTVSNLISPFMLKVDRFMIGALMSVTAVAYYATPYEMVTKLWVVPTAIVSVLFPAFAASFLRDKERMKMLFNKGVKYVLIALFPLTLLIIALAREGLDVWLGPEFADQGTRVLQLLAVGVFFNSLAQIPFGLVQGAGRPDITAKLHMVELPLYLVSLWLAVRASGIEGAALVWLARAIIDLLFLFWISHKLFFSEIHLLDMRTGLTVVFISVALALAALPLSLDYRIAFLIASLVIFIAGSWNYILDFEERRMLRARLHIPDRK